MGKVIALGIAAGAGFQAWRNYPPNGPATPQSLWLVLVVAVLLAYAGGRARRRPGAVAVAQATAVAAASAESRVQIINVVPGQGARPTGLVVPGSGDALPSWVAGERQAIDLDQLDGMDLSELVEQSAVDQDGQAL